LTSSSGGSSSSGGGGGGGSSSSSRMHSCFSCVYPSVMIFRISSYLVIPVLGLIRLMTGWVACCLHVLPPFSNPSEARCLPVYWKLNVKKIGYSDS
jgi:hypothetical protein